MPKYKPMNLVQLVDRFADDQACREYLETLRWPDGVRCPRCDHDKISILRNQEKFECASCEYQFSVMAGTIFHDSHLPLRKWFIALFLMVNSKKGISAKQLQRTIGGSYKTSWYLCHRIRKAMGNGDEPKLTGTVEVDETWIGGKREGVGSGNRVGKTAVIGAVQRGGEIRLDIITDRGRQTLHRFIRDHVEAAEAVYTDDWQAYIGIADETTIHDTVTHSKEEWVNGKVHTNSVEGVWSLLKRSIIGAYHKVSVKHLDAYLDELEFRFNNRHNPHIFRDALRRIVNTGNITYEELVSSSS